MRCRPKPGKRYFPADNEKVAVEDHKYVGADVACPACKAPNSVKAKYCRECGHPTEGANEVKESVEAADAVPVRQDKSKINSPSRGVKTKIIVGIILLVIAAAIAVVCLWKENVAIEAVNHTWQRTINIETYREVRESEWCNQMPHGAYDVTRTREVRSHKKIPDGQECSTQRASNKDGTYKEVEKCRTKYREEPVYDDKCRYLIQKWIVTDTSIAQGTGLQSEVKWPELPPLAPGRKLGSQRTGKKTETFTVHYKDKEGESYSCEFTQPKWRRVENGSQWEGEASVITGSLDCDTLQQPK